MSNKKNLTSRMKEPKQTKDNSPLLKECQDVESNNLDKGMKRLSVYNTIETKKGTLLQVVPRESQNKCFCGYPATPTSRACSLDDSTSTRTRRKKNKDKNRNRHRCSSLNHQPGNYQAEVKLVGNEMKIEAWMQNNTVSLMNNVDRPQNSWMPLANAHSESPPSLSLKKIMREEKLWQSLSNNYLKEKPRIISLPKPVSQNIKFLKELCTTFQLSCACSNSSDIYTLEDINQYSDDYVTIKYLFNKTMPTCKITSIKWVQNPFLLLQYHLKKTSSFHSSELLLYHGTKIENLDSICIDNFDWRLVSRHKYGWGVSFSTIPSYARHYSDQSGSVKAMFAVKVQVNCEWFGDCNTEVPESPFDTTTNLKDNVYVKYDDCSFYPAYLIRYTNK